MPGPITPSPRTWTVRFKSGRSAIFLHIDPLQKLDSIREELHKALLQTNPDGHFDGVRIPEDSDAILFAKPKDETDLSLGWDAIGKGSLTDDLFEEDVKGKGKGAIGKGKSRGVLEETPQSLGLHDRSVVAFKFKGRHADVMDDLDESIDDGWHVEIPPEDDEDDELEVGA